MLLQNLLKYKQSDINIIFRLTNGERSPFFIVGYLTGIEYNFTYCHDIATSNIPENGQFLIINIFKEDIKERIEKAKYLYDKLSPLYENDFQFPKIDIINDFIISVTFEPKYKTRTNLFLFLKLFRFSYLYMGETIGQLFSNIGKYKYGMSDDYFHTSSDNSLLRSMPFNWLYIFKKINGISNFLDNNLLAVTTQEIYEKYPKSHSSIWKLKEK